MYFGCHFIQNNNRPAGWYMVSDMNGNREMYADDKGVISRKCSREFIPFGSFKGSSAKFKNQSCWDHYDGNKSNYIEINNIDDQSMFVKMTFSDGQFCSDTIYKY